MDGHDVAMSQSAEDFCLGGSLLRDFDRHQSIPQRRLGGQVHASEGASAQLSKQGETRQFRAHFGKICFPKLFEQRFFFHDKTMGHGHGLDGTLVNRKLMSEFLRIRLFSELRPLAQLFIGQFDH